jgi:hypothetical protein
VFGAGELICALICRSSRVCCAFEPKLKRTVRGVEERRLGVEDGFCACVMIGCEEGRAVWVRGAVLVVIGDTYLNFVKRRKREAKR